MRLWKKAETDSVENLANYDRFGRPDRNPDSDDDDDDDGGGDVVQQHRSKFPEHEGGQEKES